MFELKAGSILLIFILTVMLVDTDPIRVKPIMVPTYETHLQKKYEVIDYELEHYINEIIKTKKSILDTLNTADTCKILVNPKI